MEIVENNSQLIYKNKDEILIIESWGKDSVRVKATKNSNFREDLSALVEPTQKFNLKIEKKDNEIIIVNGKIKIILSKAGVLKFYNDKDIEFLSETDIHVYFPTIYPSARNYRFIEGNLLYIEQKFNSDLKEKFYGLGQHQNGFLNQKGCVIDLVQRNTEVSIPFLLSSKMYGFLWNNPSIGKVELAKNFTRWISEASNQIDYFVTVGDTFKDIMNNYADATGYPPEVPDWGLGFWQSKLRYKDKEELLSIAKEYKKRGLQISVIVIDFFHWKYMGDWNFDNNFWPEVEEMVEELNEMGIKVMISIWPTVSQHSKNYELMQNQGLLLRTRYGVPVQMEFIDTEPKGPVYLTYYDPTNPKARDFIWERVKTNYYDKGIKIFWLDSCEPDIFPPHHENLKYFIGDGKEVGCAYPFFHQKGFYEGLKKSGENEILLLCRSAWAGSQRFGAMVWSGDIGSTFEDLQKQIPAGLNMGLSGISWWNADIGGFHSGEIESPYFRELIVRWFQFGIFTPLLRLHGCRLPFFKEYETGSPNEVWSFGDEAYKIITKFLFLREKLKPYLKQCYKEANLYGAPIIRPLFFDYSDDESTYEINDQFMLGSSILVAPILYYNCFKRKVYLPKNTEWYNVWSKEKFIGGNFIEVESPIEIIPVFVNDIKLTEIFNK